MPCRIGHEEGDPDGLWSMSRRDILGISGVSALTLASGVAASLLIDGCSTQKEEQQGGPKEKLTKEDFIPTFGMIALYPANVLTFQDAQNDPLAPGDPCFYVPFYNEYLTKDQLKLGLLTCRVLILGNPPVAAIAVNISDKEFIHDHDVKHPGDLDALLTQLGYSRKYREW
jgi:hypothetical protein